MKSFGVRTVAALVVVVALQAEAGPLQRLEGSPAQRGIPSRSAGSVPVVHVDTRLQLTKAEAMVKQAGTAIKTSEYQLAMESIRAAKTLVHSVEESGVVSTELVNALSGVEAAINSGDDQSALVKCGVVRDQLRAALARLP